jgi:hypothetical protein
MVINMRKKITLLLLLFFSISTCLFFYKNPDISNSKKENNKLLVCYANVNYQHINSGNMFNGIISFITLKKTAIVSISGLFTADENKGFDIGKRITFSLDNDIDLNSKILLDKTTSNVNYKKLTEQQDDYINRLLFKSMKKPVVVLTPLGKNAYVISGTTYPHAICVTRDKK